MNSVFSNKGTIAVFVLPTLLLFCGIVLIPIFVSSYYSLLDWNGVGRGTFIGLDNYVEMFKDTRVLNSIKNSLLFAGASVFIQLPISLVLALILASNVKGEGFYRTVYFIPVLISTVVIAQLWSKIYNADYGLLNVLLQSIGLSSLAQDWLGQKDTALGGIVYSNLVAVRGVSHAADVCRCEVRVSGCARSCSNGWCFPYSHGVVHHDPADEANSEGKPCFFGHRCIQGV